MRTLSALLTASVIGMAALGGTTAQAQPSEAQLTTFSNFVVACGAVIADFSKAGVAFEIAGFTEPTIDENFFAHPNGDLGGVALVNTGGDAQKIVATCAVYFDGIENDALRAYLGDRFSQFSIGTYGEDDYWRFPAEVLSDKAPEGLELLMVFAPKTGAPFPGMTLLSVGDFKAMAPSQ